MKKVLVFLFIFLLCGCSLNINDFNKDSIINEITSTLKNSSTYANTSGKGFKYYKPRDFSLLVDNDYNHILIHNNNKYYLNIDVNAYYNKTLNEYVKKDNLYYGSDFEYDKKQGFVEIKQINNYFYIKMLYNYSYVEVEVHDYELKDAIIDSIILLSSIKYNDAVIGNIISVGDLDSRETTYEIKKPKDNNKKNILDVYDYEMYN